jgi:hypothetical protein
MAGLSHDGKHIVGLQAADLIAREVFKHYDNRGVRPTRKPVLALAKHVTFHHWTRENLKEMVAFGGPDHRAEFLTMMARKLTFTESTPIIPAQPKQIS